MLLFAFWKAGLPCFIISLVFLMLVNKSGNELELKTVGQLAEKITREHYIQARRHPGTVNRAEIAQKIQQLFRCDLDLEESALMRESKLF